MDTDISGFIINTKSISPARFIEFVNYCNSFVGASVRHIYPTFGEVGYQNEKCVITNVTYQYISSLDCCRAHFDVYGLESEKTSTQQYPSQFIINE